MAAEEKDPKVQLKEMLKGVDFCMFTTFAGNAFHSRPMSTQELDDDGFLWFLSADDTRKAREIGSDHRVNAAYSDPAKNLYISVYGTAEVVKDEEKVKELWNPIFRAWFPEGLDDPTLCAIKMKVHEAEYWESASSWKIIQLASFVKAAITGNESSTGKHGMITP
ncbi:MAG: pyridoxamine 5'-phosphate oxidase family protein [Acidobacteriota bacterium]